MKGLQLTAVMGCSIKRASNERVAVKQNLRTVMDCSIRKVSNDKVAANRGQVWTTTSKVKHGKNPSIASPCA